MLQHVNIDISASILTWMDGW